MTVKATILLSVVLLVVPGTAVLAQTHHNRSP